MGSSKGTSEDSGAVGMGASPQGCSDTTQHGTKTHIIGKKTENIMALLSACNPGNPGTETYPILKLTDFAPPTGSFSVYPAERQVHPPMSCFTASCWLKLACHRLSRGYFHNRFTPKWGLPAQGTSQSAGAQSRGAPLSIPAVILTGIEAFMASHWCAWSGRCIPLSPSTSKMSFPFDWVQLSSCKSRESHSALWVSFKLRKQCQDESTLR